MTKLTVKMVPTKDLVPYANNARIHSAEQVETIANSIKEFGFNDPVGVWTNEDGQLEIVAGHGRVMAAEQLGIEKVPTVNLDHLTDEQRRAYSIVHNQTTDNSVWDFAILGQEVDCLDFDWEGFGLEIEKEAEEAEKYTTAVNVPQYEVTGEEVTVRDLYDASKSGDLAAEISESDIPENEKQFLLQAATRHVVFNYGKIAEYYAQASPEFQRLAEKSALVIIDVDDAIANGYAKLSQAIREERENA